LAVALWFNAPKIPDINPSIRARCITTQLELIDAALLSH
jgi:hypothetical protein